MKRYSLIAVLLLSSGFTSAGNDSNVDVECLAEVRGCFAHAGDDRSVCFQRSARSEACRGEELGSLVAKRAAFSSIAPHSADDIGSSEDAHLFDNSCVQNFDTFLLSNIVNGTISSDTINGLSDVLRSCTKSASQDFMRP
jgi:hypothetical protein